MDKRVEVLSLSFSNRSLPRELQLMARLEVHFARFASQQVNATLLLHSP
jgi:hypothetical protein